MVVPDIKLHFNSIKYFIFHYWHGYYCTHCTVLCCTKQVTNDWNFTKHFSNSFRGKVKYFTGCQSYQWLCGHEVSDYAGIKSVTMRTRSLRIVRLHWRQVHLVNNYAGLCFFFKDIQIISRNCFCLFIWGPGSLCYQIRGQQSLATVPLRISILHGTVQRKGVGLYCMVQRKGSGPILYSRFLFPRVGAASLLHGILMEGSVQDYQITYPTIGI